MKKDIFLLAGGMLALISACNDSAEPVTTTVTDTVTQIVTDTVTKVVEVPATIDSAAITAAYEAEHKKSKPANTNKPKKQGSKSVSIESHTPIAHHDVYIPQAEAAPSAAPSETKVIVLHDKEIIYFAPDEKPKFVGGEKAFDDFISKNMEYPDDALTYNVQGTVYTVVYLDEEGNVSKVEFPAKHLGYGLEEETRRIMSTCPRWMPARHAGKTVKSKITVPITYKIM